VQKIIGEVDPEKVRFKDVEANIVRCPDAKAADDRRSRLRQEARRHAVHRT